MATQAEESDAAQEKPEPDSLSREQHPHPPTCRTSFAYRFSIYPTSPHPSVSSAQEPDAQASTISISSCLSAAPAF